METASPSQLTMNRFNQSRRWTSSLIFALLRLATARTDSTLDPAIQSVVKQPRLDNTRTNHREEVAKQVITDIEQSSIRIHGKDHGGKVGEIVYSAGILSVHQTERNMAETSKILQLMEEAHQLQISIETRVMMVDDDLFKKFAAAFPASHRRRCTATGGKRPY